MTNNRYLVNIAKWLIEWVEKDSRKDDSRLHFVECVEVGKWVSSLREINEIKQCYSPTSNKGRTKTLVSSRSLSVSANRLTFQKEMF